MSQQPAGPYDIHTTYLHLADGGQATALPVTATFWQDLGSGALAAVGESGRLVSTGSYASDWTSWEMHPQGEEFVCLMSGAADFLLQRADGGVDTVHLAGPGAFVLVPAGAWHTAKVSEPTSMLFITPGTGTEHKPV